MKALKHLGLAGLIGLTSTLSLTALAQSMDSSKTGSATASAETDMTDGEIRKVDKDNKKLTIKHGDIKNLEMPGMTMVFQVKDPAMVEQIKVGDKIRFKVEKSSSGFVVTELQPASK